MSLTVNAATKADAPALAVLRTRVAQHLARRHGTGHWSVEASENGVLRDINIPAHLLRPLMAREDDAMVGSLRLATK